MEQKKKLALGTAYFGTKTDAAESMKLLDYFYEHGGVVIDTANSYAAWETNGRGGDSERVIGQWLSAGKHRDKITIISKLGFGYDNVNQGFGNYEIITECEKSLKRLRTDCIDYYLAHLDDENTPLEKSIHHFQNLMKQGKIKNWGLSNYSCDRLSQIISICVKNKWIRPKLIQNHFSLLKAEDDVTFSEMNWQPLNPCILNICQEEGIEAMAHSSLLWGSYARDDKPLWGSFNSGDNKRKIIKIRDKAKRLGITPNQFVLSHIIRQHVTPVIGVSSLSQLKENLGALEAAGGSEQ